MHPLRWRARANQRSVVRGGTRSSNPLSSSGESTANPGSVELSHDFVRHDLEPDKGGQSIAGAERHVGGVAPAADQDWELHFRNIPVAAHGVSARRTVKKSPLAGRIRGLGKSPQYRRLPAERGAHDQEH